MKTKLAIEIQESEVTLRLKVADKEIDKVVWQEKGSLSRKLLTEIDALLKKNDLDIRDLDTDIEIKTDNESYTSARIVKIVGETIKYSLEN